MFLKNILVHLDNSHHSTARLELAISLAQRHQARLTALYVIAHQFYQPERIDAGAKTDQFRTAIDALIRTAGVKVELLSIDSKVAGATIGEIINMQANCSDLVIIGQTDPSSSSWDTPADLPEHIILGSGRPVLIVPYTDSHKDLGHRVLVAWKAGRESARAVNDAIPLLAGAEIVKILTVNPADQSRNDGERLCAHLACHSICARAECSLATGISVGDVLLNRAADEGSDLLVMGAFTQTLLGRPALGDVARHILKHMTVPVLMSH